MAMDFWEAQRKARSRTNIYLTIFVILTICVAILAEFAMRLLAQDSYDPPLPIVGLAFLVITFSVAAYNYGMYQEYGGSYVAETMGAKRVNPQTTNLTEKQLLNIVEEVAIAASLPFPPIYIIPAQQINAFAAGLNTKNAIIAVTQGSLQTLNRDELQGVIAHEFGHIYNGDMKISMRLAAMVMGFFFVLYLGLRLIQFSSFSSRKENGKGGNPVVIAAFVLIAAGALTWLFGTLLKCCVSREREYLADACAVQFTRNPHGIANALRKIGQAQTSDMPTTGMAFTHLYFDDYTGLSALFATHPPLDKRIAAIEGRVYIQENWDEMKNKHSNID